MADSPLLILLPVLNDWRSARRLVGDLARVLHASGRTAEVLIVDDGSSEPCNERWDVPASVCPLVRRLTLKRNVGHQRAICIGLAYVAEHHPCEAVVVMDADGEDDPDDVPRLLAEFDRQGGRQVVFAERRKRSESLYFQAGYFMYRQFHRVLVGARVRVGNFSVVSFETIVRLAVVPELWSHFAAAVLASGLTYTTVPTARAVRYDGKSRMNTVGLIVHGMSALTVYNDRIGARLLMASGAIGLAGLAGVVALAIGHLAGAWSISQVMIDGTVRLGTLYVVLVALLLLFCSLTLGIRAAGTFLPVRDYHWFVKDVGVLSPSSGVDLHEP